jgi:tetratricopeptide (TPR) repeat protein
MKMKRLFYIPLSLVLFGCAAETPTEVSHNAFERAGPVRMKTFPNAAGPVAVKRSNVDIANAFLDLSFALESGQDLPVLSRFEGPITVAITDKAPANVVHELDLLMARLRNEAGLNIHRITKGVPNIYVDTVPKKQLQSMVPTAACFVVPNVTGWSDYRRNRYNKVVDWTRLKKRERATVFMPNDVSLQESRDCLHEEIAQVLGPVNDLYRLPDSVYNDDNFYLSLTAHDMLILKTYYAPEIRNGMVRAEAASVLPTILARLNPIGQTIPPKNLKKTAPEWVHLIARTLGPRISNANRRRAADRAVQMAKDYGYNDHRLGFAYFARGEVSLHDDPHQAALDFTQAYMIYKTLFGASDIHTAKAAVQMASLSMSAGNLKEALTYIDQSIPAAHKAQDGALLFSLLTMKAEAYEGLGRYADANTLRQQAIGWGYYGLASGSEIAKRMDMVATLRPRVSTKGL